MDSCHIQSNVGLGTSGLIADLGTAIHRNDDLSTSGLSQITAVRKNIGLDQQPVKDCDKKAYASTAAQTETCVRP